MKHKMLLFFLIMALPALACGEATPAAIAPTSLLTSTQIPSATALPQPTVTALVAPTDTPQPNPTFELTEVAPPERQQATVLRVIDGDTIEVQIGDVAYTLRYIGIDTPETKHPEKGVQWMGQEAAAANEALVGGQTVLLEKDISEMDKYGRLLRYVWTVDNLMANAELVRLGFAQVSTYPPDTKYADLFLELQQEARDAERGLWGVTPTPISIATALVPSPVAISPTLPSTPEQPAVAAPTQTEAPSQAVCDCSGNNYNCSDFSTHAAAQACYDYCVAQGHGDIHRLDGTDNDGLACESLP